MNNLTLNTLVSRTEYIINNNLTISEAAKQLNLDTSTLYKNLRNLEKINPKLHSIAIQISSKKHPLDYINLQRKDKNFEQIYKERLNYMINNNLSFKTAAQQLNIEQSTLYCNFKFMKQIDIKFYNKIKKYLKDNKNFKEKTKKEKLILIDKSLYLQFAEYVLNNNNYNSTEELAALFNLTPDVINGYMINLKYYNIELYNKVRNKIKFQIAKKEIEKLQTYINYILENNCSRKQFCQHFNLNTDQVHNLLYDHLKYCPEFNKIQKIFLLNKETKYNLYADYILENKCAYAETAKYFNANYETIRSSIIFLLKDANFEKYKQVKKVIDEYRLNKKLTVKEKKKDLLQRKQEKLQIKQNKLNQASSKKQEIQERKENVIFTYNKYQCNFKQLRQHCELTRDQLGYIIKLIKKENYNLYLKMKESNVK